MLRIALPNKGTLAEPAATILRDAGYRQRFDSRDLSILDDEQDIEFFYLRPKDIAAYVASGDLHLGVTGTDMIDESGSRVRAVIGLGFGASQFRFAAPVGGLDGREWTLPDLEGRRVATSYPRIVRNHLMRHGVTADIVELDGAVEISVRLGLADAVADVVATGRTLSQHGLAPFGPAIIESQATLIEQEPDPDHHQPRDVLVAKEVFASRLQGVVYARKYVMVDYNCPKDLIEDAKRITPGIQAPTVAHLSDPDWFGVRALVPKRLANIVLDDLARLGTRAIMVSDLRSCRAWGPAGGE